LNLRDCKKLTNISSLISLRNLRISR
jgi:hypothetical protein